MHAEPDDLPVFGYSIFTRELLNASGVAVTEDEIGFLDGRDKKLQTNAEHM
jgi:hypothetical protein